MDTDITAPPAPLPQAPAAPPAQPRRRWWVYVLVFVGALALVPVAMFGYHSYATRQDWDDAEAEADRLDPGWRFDDLLLAQEPIDPKENSGSYLMGLAAQKKSFQVAAVKTYDDIFKDLPTNAKLNRQQRELIRDELDKIAKPLAEARQLKDMPRGRFPIKYSPDYIATLIPNHQDARDIADWLKHDAYDLADQGKFDAAVESCQAMLCIARVFADDLFVVSHLIRVAVHTQMAIALERTLGQGEAGEETLRNMQEVVAREIAEAGWLRAIRGERAGGHLLFTNVRSGKLKETYLRAMMTGKGPASVGEWVQDKFPSTMLRYYPEHLRRMTRAVEIAKLPLHEQRKPVQEWHQEASASTNPIVMLMRPAFSKVYEVDCRSQGTLRSMQAALACERYRLRYKDWPKSLEELVRVKLLDAVPLDPIDGQPLRMIREAKGIVIYSLGADQKDNRGRFDRERPGEDGFDVGFRLWDRGERAAKERPVVAVPDPK